MAIASWNARGINGDDAVRQTKLLMKYHKPDFLFLMETKLAEGRIKSVCRKLGFDHGFEVPRTGLSGGLMALWHEKVEVTYLSSSSNHFSCFLRIDNQPTAWHFCGFYGDPRISNRQFTWELLQKLRSVYTGPWLVMGDFNEILSQEDKEGGGLRNESQIEAFRNSLEVCALQPLDYKGEHFTWIRKTVDGCIKERLDWAMANEEWLEYFPNNSLTHLDFFHSDHRVLLLCVQDPTELVVQNSRKRTRFRFENLWVGEPESREIISTSWVLTDQSALLSTINNIKLCSSNLESWNQAKFGSMAKEIKKTHQNIIKLHNLQDQLENVSELTEMKQKLNELLRKEEVFWKQRSRVEWLKAGDQNTKFFHQKAKQRKRINTIKGLLDEDNEWCSNEEKMGAMVQRYYGNLFTTSLPEGEKIEELLMAVQPLITEEMCRPLEKVFTVEEIKKALFSMSPDKSPGPDGMNAMFYQQHWDIVGPLVSKAILDCLNGEAELEEINSTLVTLIPKVKEPKAVGDFRPISLCNVLYKVISKVIINRMKPILPVIISSTQSAFVPGRLITDNALIAYECLHHLRQMKGGKRCFAAMKLDMSKAYDRVEWCFIERMLMKMGFPLQWVNKIMRCVKSVRYSFQINGQTYGEVTPSRGLRQGDPLSPYLFLICAEGFSALLRQAEVRGNIMGLKIARNAPSISHLFFADDSLLFIKATTKSLQVIQRIFLLYSECSGQMINFNKSILFFSPNTGELLRSEFAVSLKMDITEAIETYLGLPMMGGKNKKLLFRTIKDKIWIRLHSWRAELFSQAGKEILLKAVIQAMPTYVMSCFRIPEGLCQEIEKLMARYWWGSVQSKRKIHWRAWKKISIPKSEGGLGFRNFVQYNQALLAKQVWRILVNPTSLISQILQAKYFTNSSFLEAKEGSYPSLTWRGICWGKKLLIRGLRRRIGNGLNTNAAKDPWIPRPPTFLPITKEVNENIKVSDLMEHTGKWNKQVIEQNFLSPDSQMILTIPLSPYNHTDAWLWHYNKNGSYSVKSGYQLATNIEEASPSSSTETLSTWWKTYWSTKLPRKMILFGWRGYHEILPTLNGLCRRKITMQSNCPICGYAEDSNAHAIFWCHFAQEVWKLLEYQFLVGHKEEISFKGVLLYASEFLEREDFAKMIITAWGIWTERNKQTHGQQKRSPQQIKEWVASYYEEVRITLSKERGELANKELSIGEQAEVEIQDLTLFADAAISTGSFKVGLGIVILDKNKKIKAALAKPLEGELTVFHAEALALLVGMFWAQTIGLPIRRISSDSLSLIKALENKSEYHDEAGILLSDIRLLMASFPEATLSHINRKFNMAAHNMAKHAIKLEEEASWIEEIPT